MMHRLILILLVLSLSGCALFQRDESDNANNWTLERLYNEAKTAMQRSNYSRAIELYEFLETRYPFGVYGMQALLDLAYVYYKMGDHEAALSTADRFIRLYPQNNYVDYAYYLKGLVNFNRDRSVSERLFPTDTSERDTSSAMAAFRNFTELLERFPDSRYAEDAASRMVYLRNLLARSEIHVAEYYLRRGAYVAAVNRARFVVENYSRTTAVPDALVIMAKAYRILDMNDLSEDALRVLQLNHPTHQGAREVRGIVLN
jgi:outer membrane protein assembly factor BamD